MKYIIKEQILQAKYNNKVEIQKRPKCYALVFKFFSFFSTRYPLLQLWNSFFFVCNGGGYVFFFCFLFYSLRLGQPKKIWGHLSVLGILGPHFILCCLPLLCFHLKVAVQQWLQQNLSDSTWTVWAVFVCTWSWIIAAFAPTFSLSHSCFCLLADKCFVVFYKRVVATM